jgi:NAD(P)H-dependent flavin oxidoreductase YrpB (nitropropane dioxygenase family)
MTDTHTPAPADQPLPLVIQGGMGAGVSSWRLARTVSAAGQLGVVSGTGLDSLLVRQLQDGDPGGHLRRAMAAFPIPGVAARVLERFFLPGGRPAGRRYAALPMPDHRASAARDRVTVLANFVEVFLARDGHDAPVGINYLTKIQPPTLPSLYGAMLAGVSCVLMGAGIPRDIPAALDRLAAHEPATLRLEVAGGEPVPLPFDPRALWGDVTPPPLHRPRFIAIVASNLLATMLARKATGRVDGFVVEGPTAGGHNAPPRGELRLDDGGQPIYGERDVVDLAAIAELGRPFWVAGGAGSPEALRAARAAGAAGVQVGTLFAFCEESGLADAYRAAVLRDARAGRVRVRTDPRASPTGYPFKIVEAPSLPSVDESRERVCDLGYLRAAYRRDDGTIGYRCPGEPVAQYVRKGGAVEDTAGRRCLCNALLANIGLGQLRDGGRVERPLLTSGDDLVHLAEFLAGRERYGAVDVVEYLLGSRV